MLTWRTPPACRVDTLPIYFYHLGTGVERSLDAARTSAYAT